MLVCGFMCSEPSRLDLGLRLFLSHSGADKPFARNLLRRLEEEGYSAFLDEKSLYVGHVVDMTNILLEVEDCDVAVFVISEDFFMRTKNPMLELAASVGNAFFLSSLGSQLHNSRIGAGEMLGRGNGLSGWLKKTLSMFRKIMPTSSAKICYV